ncbi:T6SS effector phospholipase Tle3 domain-containing protein [Collimonas humicola]
MPGTVIFVHGVNSQGEWYKDASDQFSEGLKKRLGRTDLMGSTYNKHTKRFTGLDDNGDRARSPIIPFYWGYSVAHENLYKVMIDHDVRPARDEPDSGFLDRFGNYLGDDFAWGGGPFQNGTNNLLQFWKGGFQRKILGGLVDLKDSGPLGRQLNDCPDRMYFVHAARRLAHLVDTIRTDVVNEPINIVAHSQGTMIALCAMLYLKTRGPDTLILNSSPLAFDSKFLTDYFAAKDGLASIQSEAARLATFQHIAGLLKASGEAVKESIPKAPRTNTVKLGETAIHFRHAPDHPQWQPQIGSMAINRQGQYWWQDPLRSRDNRGKLFVNFNPGDRLIGVSPIGGVGWRGIPSTYLDNNKNLLGENIYQRIFARASKAPDNPPVGSRTDYRQHFFYEKTVIDQVQSDYGARNAEGREEPLRWTDSYGSPINTVNQQMQTWDGKVAGQFWTQAEDKMLLVIPVQSTPDWTDYVYVNAPLVPEPAELGTDFDQPKLPFSGVGLDGNGDDYNDNGEQAEDFAIYKRHATLRNGETVEQQQARFRKEGQTLVDPTNHGTILRYAGENGFPVERVLSYDLTVGQGYAFGDEQYWKYLLDLADWKISDPYYQNGDLSREPTTPPLGLDTRTLTEYIKPATYGNGGA